MPARSYALMKLDVCSDRRSIGSTVRSNVASPVLLAKSAMTTDTGSCAGGGISERAYHQPPPTRPIETTIIAAKLLTPNTRLTGTSVPSSVSLPSSVSSSTVVWKRFSGSGSRQRVIRCSSGSGTSGTKSRIGVGVCCMRARSSAMGPSADECLPRPTSAS